MPRLVFIVFIASCTSLTLDGSTPFVSLRGSPPATAGRQQLHGVPGDDPFFVRGADGVSWVLQPPAHGTVAAPTLVRLGDPPDQLMLDLFTRSTLTQGAVFGFVYDITSGQLITVTHVTMTRPGAAPVRFDFDQFVGDVVDSDNEAALYFPPSTSEAMPSGSGLIVRTDGSFRRTLDNVTRTISFFDHDGEVLFTVDSDGVIRAHFTREARDVDLGPWSLQSQSAFVMAISQVLLLAGTALAVCDDLGLRILDLPPASPRTLDSDPCQDGSVTLIRDRLVYRAASGTLRSVPLDGSAPPVALAHAESPPLAIDADRVVWTKRTQAQFSPYDVGDGWVDDRQFMERGHYPIFSADGRRLYFLEHAANGDGVGELRSYEIATGINHLLALNTRRFEELPDGRLIAVTNSWTDDQWNRVVVIDEARRTGTWVADGADGFTLIPAQSDVLVDLVTNSGETTMVRMPIPP